MMMMMTIMGNLFRRLERHNFAGVEGDGRTVAKWTTEK
jgi:hypothetical protein